MRPTFDADKLNRADAEAFIKALTGDAKSKVTFQIFHDSDKAARSGRWFHGTLDEHWDQLVQLNREGHGIYIMVNEGDGKGRKASNVLGLRALFIDDDGKNEPVTFTGVGVAPFTSMPPSISVQSKAGQHHFFLLPPGERLEDFKHAQEALAAHFGSDAAVKDLPRVMRVPGFFHMKDPKDPFLVKLVQVSSRRYSIDEVLNAYPAPPTMLDLPSDERLARAAAYVAKVPVAIEGQKGDRQTFKVCAALVRNFGLTEEEALPILRDWNARCLPPWSESQLLEKLKNAEKYGTHAKGSKAGPRAAAHGWTDRRVIDVCVPILDTHFRLHRDEKSGATHVYRVIDAEASLVTHEDLLEQVLFDALKESLGEPPFLKLLSWSVGIWRKATTAIHYEPEPFAFQDDQRLAFKRFNWKPEPQPYPAWEQFTRRLSDAPAFMAFVWSIFEPTNTGRQYLWLHGSGEDGKSVVLTVIKNIFGAAGTALNAVHFTKENRFVMSLLFGKRVAIYPDCKRPMMVMSEIVRNITSGDPVQIEFKGKDSFSGVLKCKLLIGANEMPILTGGNADKSRCLLIDVKPSEVTDDPTWPSKLEAELPGFLWACQEQYRARCPHGGKIELSAESVALRDEVITDAESKFTEIFEVYFVKDDSVELPAHLVRQVLAQAGMRSDQEVRDFKAYLQRVYGIKQRKKAGGLRYPALALRNPELVFRGHPSSPAADSRSRVSTGASA